MHALLDSLKHFFPIDLHPHIMLVGGCLRDLLRGLPCKDIDLVCTLTPEDLTRLGFRAVRGKTTIPIWQRTVAGTGTLEATLIADRSDIVEDLTRRDFTVHAMAMDLDGNLIDPLGGYSDLLRLEIRSCSPESFKNDPLRIFRALRLEADGWIMEKETAGLLTGQDWSAELEALPVERFSREMLKALAARHPDRFFSGMLKYRVGRCFLPELFRWPEIPAGPVRHHPEGDLFSHAIQVVQRVASATPDPLTRLCAFFHDIGKQATTKECYPSHHGHDRAGEITAQAFCRNLRLPAAYGTSLAAVCALHTTYNNWGELRPSTRLKLAERAVSAGVAGILPLVSAADKPDNPQPDQWPHIVEIASLSATTLGIPAERLLKLAPLQRREAVRLARLSLVKSVLSQTESH